MGLPALTPRTHLAIILLPVAVLLAAATALNISVDPYGVWRTRRMDGYNRHIPQAYVQDRYFKTVDSLRAAPRTLLVGTSRVGMGMDPAAPILGPGAYNLGLTGADMVECWRTWQHVESRHAQQRVVLALDFMMFDARRPSWPGFAEERLRTGPGWWPRPLAWTWDIPAQLLSKDAVQASLATLAINRRPPPVVAAFTRGMFDERLFVTDIAAKGVRQGFEGRRTDFLPKYLDWAWNDRRGDNRQRDAFVAMLQDAHRLGRDLRIVLNPEHAWLLELIAAAGLADDADAWRAWVVEANRSVAQAAGRQPFPIFDAFGWTPISTRLVPAAGARETDPWWWEASHYRKELGLRLLTAVITGREDPELGRFLREPADAVAAAAAGRAVRAAWTAADPDPAAMAEMLVRELRRQRSGAVSRAEMRRLREELRRRQAGPSAP